MKMKMENNQYDKLIDILRQSKPEFKASRDVGNAVLSKIGNQNPGIPLSDIKDILFGWVYISWVRRILVTCSVLLLVVFIWQQRIIIKEINFLSNQVMIQNRETSYDPSGTLEKKLILHRLTDQKSDSQVVQIQRLIDSLNNLQVKYRNILDLIEEDQELRDLIEQKMKETSRLKIKI
jgi:hypothetical protein